MWHVRSCDVWGCGRSCDVGCGRSCDVGWVGHVMSGGVVGHVM